MTQGRLLPCAPSSVSFLVFFFRYRSRRVRSSSAGLLLKGRKNDQDFIVGQTVEVIDEEVDLLLQGGGVGRGNYTVNLTP